MRELLSLLSPEEQEALWESKLTYPPAAGTEGLRQVVADWNDVEPDDVQIVTGASEGLLCLFHHVAEPGANVVLPAPGYPGFAALPETLGLEVRSYRLRTDESFRIDPDEIRSLVDDRTKLLLINRPHNPTGKVLSEKALRELHDFAAARNVLFVVDEVFHPVYHGETVSSASKLPQAVVLGDMSKALCLSGLRVGWIIERDRERRQKYWNARAYFTLTNNSLGEALAEHAVRHRIKILSRASRVASANLKLLRQFFAQHEDTLSWVPPEGGFTVFPRLKVGDDARPFCLEAANRGVLLAPGDTFGEPAHFRLGFGACENGFVEALEILSDVVKGVREPAREAS